MCLQIQIRHLSDCRNCLSQWSWRSLKLLWCHSDWNTPPVKEVSFRILLRPCLRCCLFPPRSKFWNMDVYWKMSANELATNSRVVVVVIREEELIQTTYFCRCHLTGVVLPFGFMPALVLFVFQKYIWKFWSIYRTHPVYHMESLLDQMPLVAGKKCF